MAGACPWLVPIGRSGSGSGGKTSSPSLGQPEVLRGIAFSKFGPFRPLLLLGLACPHFSL
eukprot:6791218-Heterocapsa_arctica.AAC.1